MIHRVHLCGRHDLHIFVGWGKDIVHNFVACIQSYYWFRKAACQSYAADFLLIFLSFFFSSHTKMYWNVLLTYYHVVSLFGPMSTNYHKHEIETEMRLFSFSFFSLVFSVILFLFLSFCVLVILQRQFSRGGCACLLACLHLVCKNLGIFACDSFFDCL